MNKKLICFNLFFFFLIVIVSLFSCKNSPVIEPINPQHTVNFYVWNNNQNKYIESTQTVEEGTLFSSISKPSTPTFEKDGNRYIFEDWVEKYTPSDVENSIIVRGVNINENIEIKAPKTFYAKYNSKAIIRHTVLFNIWDKSQNKYIEKSQSIEEGTLFGSITKPEPPIFDRNSSTYTFLGWVEKADFINDFNILTEGEIVNNNIQISANKSYYAKYTSSPCFNVTLRIYDKDLSKYVVKDIIKVEQGEILSNIVNKYTSIEDVVIEGVRYTFIGWVSNSEDLNNILTEGEIVEDNIRVTENKTYSAKYSNKKINHTIIFNVWDDIQNKYVEIPQTVEYGTVFSSIEKPPVPTFYDFEKRRMYTFLGWVEKDEIQSAILMNGVVIDNNTKITKNRILYAKYSNDYFFYVFLKVYDKAFSKYVVKETLYFNERLTLYGINKYNKIVDDLEIDGISYSFYGWAKASSSNEILEDFNTNKLEDHNFISSDTTLCAIYQGDYLAFTAVDEIEIHLILLKV